MRAPVLAAPGSPALRQDDVLERFVTAVRANGCSMS